MRRSTFLTSLAAGALGAALGFAPFAATADFPDRPVKLVVPFGAGGATHTLARLFAEQFEKALGQTVAVTAVPGSGGAVGSAQVARAKPDGYTLLMGSNGTNGMRWQVSETGYDMSNFASLGAVAALPTGWAVATSSPIRSMPQLVDHIKKNPGVKYASVGTGTSLHIAGERWALGAGLQIVHIGARGGKDAIVKLLSGEVAFVVVAASNFPAQKKNGEEGQIRALSVSSAEPYEFASDIPTMRSLGYGFADVTWWGPFAVAGTPEPVLDKLATAVRSAAQSPEFRAVLKKFNYSSSYMAPNEAAANLADYAKQTEIILRKIGMHKEVAKKS